MVWCIIPGFNEGRVLLNYRIFQTFWVTPPLSMSTQFGLTCLKTPNAKNREKYPRPDRDPGAGTLYCKKLLHSIFQYKIRSKDRQLNRTWSQPVPGRVATRNKSILEYYSCMYTAVPYTRTFRRTPPRSRPAAGLHNRIPLFPYCCLVKNKYW